MNKNLSIMATIIIGILALLIPYTCAMAQNPELVVYDTTNSGIPSNDIRSLAIEGNGTKWMTIGGFWIETGYVGGGLTSFDGTTWTVYDNSNSGLPSNEVLAIAIDGDGTKWIGTGQGLASFDGATWTVFDTTNSGLPGNVVNAIAIDNSGTKWIASEETDDLGGSDKGLASYDGTIWIVYNTANSGLPSNDIWSIAIDSNGTKWIGTYEALVSFDGTNWVVYTDYTRVTSIAFDNNGTTWIGTAASGLASYNGSDWTRYDDELYPDVAASRRISTIAIDEYGTKWIGLGLTANGFYGGDGLCRYDDETWVFYHPHNSGLPAEFISSIVIDDSGNKWMGTTNGFGFGSGLVVYNEGGILVEIEDDLQDVGLAANFRLDQNYPNPFNPTTTIQYSLPEAGSVKLIIFDMLGQEITTLEQSDKHPGNYAVQWSGLDQSGNPVSTGVYFARMEAGDFSQTIKMMYLK